MPTGFLVLWAALASAMCLLFVRKRTATIDVQRYQWKRMLNVNAPSGLLTAGSWFNVFVSGAMAVGGWVAVIVRLFR